MDGIKQRGGRWKSHPLFSTSPTAQVEHVSDSVPGPLNGEASTGLGQARRRLRQSTVCKHAVVWTACLMLGLGLGLPGAANAQSTASQALPFPSSDTPPATQPSSENQSTGQPATPAVTREQLEALKAQVEADTELTPEAKKPILESITAALLNVGAAADLTARGKKLEEQLETVEATRSSKQTTLAELQKRTLDSPTAYVDLPQKEQALALKRSDLIKAQSELEKAEAALDGRNERQRALKETLAAIPSQKEAVQAQLNQLGSGPDPDLATRAKRLALLAEKNRLEIEPTVIQNELAKTAAEDAGNILQLNRQIEALRVEQLKTEIQALTDAIAKARRKDARTRADVANDKANEIEATDDKRRKELAELYRENARIVQEELSLQSKQQTLQDEVENTTQTHSRLADDLVQVRKREGRTGTSRSFGLRLREQRDQLPNPQELRQSIRQRNIDFETAHLEYFSWLEKQKNLNEIDAKVKHLVAAKTSLSDLENSEVEQLEQDYRDAYNQQLEYVSKVVAAYDEYIETLDSYDVAEESLAKLSSEFADYIDRRVLWIPSHRAISWKDITSDVTALNVFFDSDSWQKILNALATDARHHWFLYPFFLLIWIFLIATQSKQSRRIQQTGKKAASRLNTSMKPTVQASLMTFSKSVLLPLPILFIGWRLSATSNLTSLYSLAQNLIFAGTGLLALEFIRNVHRSFGLGPAHFGWPKEACKLVEDQVGSFIVLVTPLLLVIGVLNAWQSETDSQTLSRIFSITVYLLVAISFHRLTHHETGVVGNLIAAHRDGWFNRFSKLLYPLAVSVPLIMAGLTAAGFTYATERLALKLGQTVLLFFGAMFIRGVLLRWLTIRQRRLAVEQARQARAAQAEAGTEAAPKSTVPQVADDKTKLAEVSAQAKRLLNTTVIIFSLVGLWAVWTEVLPALHYFDNWALPNTEIRLPQMVAAIVIAVLTTTAARNIPGLLEITLLEWLPFDKSSRYAIGALTRYVIAFVGLVAVAGQLHISWDSVQWLAAALTFGLGFGLQEIFANFVSGLIILFEQPVRVGDVVTIDGVSGVVSRIRIRATTITDWDRKEYIVPNREFITGKLLNWTLTDTTNRIIIEVGVAYGSDTKRVHEIMMKVVNAHPLILREPPPVVTFDGFGDSSLNFTMRAFLPALDQRLQTIHDLHVAIDQAFEEEGIEIPFPQRDLHVRSTVPFFNGNEAVPDTTIDRSLTAEEAAISDASSNGETS